MAKYQINMPDVAGYKSFDAFDDPVALNASLTLKAIYAGEDSVGNCVIVQQIREVDPEPEPGQEPEPDPDSGNEP